MYSPIALHELSPSRSGLNTPPVSLGLFYLNLNFKFNYESERLKTSIQVREAALIIF